jgi:LL-diaminopimelate aminotransferase
MIPLSKRISQVTTYYFATKLAEVDSMNKDGGIPIINLGIGSPDLLPHPIVIETLNKASMQHDANKYQSYKGLPELRQAYSNWYKRFFAVDLDSGTEILPLIGSKEAVMHISMAFLNDGDEVLVPNPGYPSYESCARLAGATPINMPLAAELGWKPDLEALEKTDLSRVKLMWVNYPNMPTGAIADKTFFEKLVEFGTKHNILICHDNPYAFILTDNPISILSIEGAKNCCIELTSMSKCYNMAGWRIGAVSGAKACIDAILTFKSNMDSGMYKPIQMAAIEALNLDKSWIDNLNAEYKLRQKAAKKIMQLIGCSFDQESASLFVWGKLPQGVTDLNAFSDEILYGARVFLTPGHVFGSEGNNYLRISLCSPVTEMEAAYSRIANFMNSKKDKK